MTTENKTEENNAEIVNDTDGGNQVTKVTVNVNVFLFPWLLFPTFTTSNK